MTKIKVCLLQCGEFLVKFVKLTGHELCRMGVGHADVRFAEEGRRFRSQGILVFHLHLSEALKGWLSEGLHGTSYFLNI